MFKMEFILNDEENQIKVTSKGEISNAGITCMYDTLTTKANDLKEKYINGATKNLAHELNLNEKLAKRLAEFFFNKTLEESKLEEEN